MLAWNDHDGGPGWHNEGSVRGADRCEAAAHALEPNSEPEQGACCGCGG